MEKTYMKIYRKLLPFYISLHKWRDDRCEYSVLQRCRYISSKSVSWAQFYSTSSGIFLTIIKKCLDIFLFKKSIWGKI